MNTVQEYFNKEKEIYVYNATNPLGIISIAFGEQMDKHFTIPKTTKPICITDRVPKKFIEESQSFRNLVASGKVSLITKVEYEKVMQAPGVKEIVEKQIQDLERKTVEVQEKIVSEVNPRILQLVHIMSLPEGSDQEGTKPSVAAVIEELGTLNLSESDCGFLMSNSTGKIKKWATKYFQEKFKEE